MSFEPTEKMKAAYKTVRAQHWLDHYNDLADLAQHATAAAMEAEHQLNVEHGAKDFDADWLKLAAEKLREVKR